MDVSIVIAAHNEGRRLARTVASCRESLGALEPEIIIADDASTDGSLADLATDAGLRVVRHPERRGASPTKDMGARAASGAILVFLDGHCKPAEGALERLVADVKATSGRAIVTPAVPSLDEESWEVRPERTGFGYRMTLDHSQCRWTGLAELERSPTWPDLYESPGLIGCCLAVDRGLYERLRGFDPDMRSWGVEDIDLGLKSWLMGHPLLHDPLARVGHRFRARFDNYDVPMNDVIANRIRMARKNFTEPTWAEWQERTRHRLPEYVWDGGWATFEERRASVEAERDYLLAHRVHDEFWYADRFGLTWPGPPDRAAAHANANADAQAGSAGGDS